MGQTRVSDAWVTNTEMAEDLAIPSPNVRRDVVRTLGLKESERTIAVLEDEKGAVRAFQAPHGRKPTWMWRRELVERVKELRAQ